MTTFRTGIRNVAVSAHAHGNNGPKRIANGHQSPKYPVLQEIGVAEFNGGDAISAAVLFASVRPIAAHTHGVIKHEK